MHNADLPLFKSDVYYLKMNWLHVAVILASRQQMVKCFYNIDGGTYVHLVFFFLQKLCAGLALEDQMYM